MAGGHSGPQSLRDLLQGRQSSNLGDIYLVPPTLTKVNELAYVECYYRKVSVGLVHAEDLGVSNTEGNIKEGDDRMPVLHLVKLDVAQSDKGEDTHT